MTNISMIALNTLREASNDNIINVSNLGFSNDMSKSILEELEYKGLVKYIGVGMYLVTEKGCHLIKKNNLLQANLDKKITLRRGSNHKPPKFLIYH